MTICREYGESGQSRERSPHVAESGKSSSVKGCLSWVLKDGHISSWTGGGKEHSAVGIEHKGPCGGGELREQIVQD